MNQAHKVQPNHLERADLSLCSPVVDAAGHGERRELQAAICSARPSRGARLKRGPNRRH